MSKKKAIKKKPVDNISTKKKQNSMAKPKADKYKLWLVFILAITFIVYFAAIKNGFVNFDDERYILQNEAIKDISAQNIKTWFTTYFDGHYHPLSQLSLAIDYKIASSSLPANFQIQELKANVFHFTNILLHLLNVLFVFLLLKKLFGKNEIAIIAALLFGLHPINVESVAWASERKNLLFAFFFLTSLFNYVKFLQLDKRKYYLYSLLLFLFAVFSKVTAISLFFSLFIVEYLVDKKPFKPKLLLLKLPYFAIAVLFLIIASLAQSSAFESNAIPYSFFDKIFLASFGFMQYVIKTIAPFNLSVFYPYPFDIGKEISIIQYLSPVFVIGVLILIIILIRKKQKEFAFGLAFFVLNIAFLVKLFDIPKGNYLMADRYSYIPSIGIFIIIAWAFIYLADKFKKQRTTYLVVLSIYIIILGISTNVRTKIWENSTSLWTDVIENYPGYTFAYNMRGMDRVARQDYQGGVADFQESINLNPNIPDGYMNIGMVYMNTGNPEGAIDIFSKAIEKIDTLAQAYFYRGYIEFQTNNFQKAIDDFDKNLELKPNNATSLLNRGLCYYKLTQYEKAIADYNLLIKIRPDTDRVWYLRGLAYYDSGETEKACEDWQKAMELGLDIGEEIRTKCK
ncbi:MAG: tetratricopeptide repeat protein [Saprospiraceae bacterium]|nr:tetratricopeptide repeat protein [Saprospiraceae bacterium]